MKPIVSSVVVYTHPGSTEGEHCRQSPAIVQAVHQGEPCVVDLWVFTEWGMTKENRKSQGDGPCNWNWPVGPADPPRLGN